MNEEHFKPNTFFKTPAEAIAYADRFNCKEFPRYIWRYWNQFTQEYVYTVL